MDEAGRVEHVLRSTTVIEWSRGYRMCNKSEQNMPFDVLPAQKADTDYDISNSSV
jgi:hypothetical protein